METIIAQNDEEMENDDLSEENEEEQRLREEFGDSAIDAALDLGIDIADIEDAYIGRFDSNEKFAQEMAESMHRADFGVWPFYCINWEMAADEVMMDYEEKNGFYFRVF